jgi:hypothetical protein
VYAVLVGFGLRYIYKLLYRGPAEAEALPAGTTPKRPMAVAVTRD